MAGLTALHLHAGLATYGAVLLAELPDKSLLASLALATRYRPVLVWLGAVSAFAVHVAVGVAAGGLLARLPQRPLHLLVAIVLLALSAVLLAGSRSQADGSPGHTEPAVAALGATTPAWRAAGVSFVLVFMGELGDLTQILTVNLAARFEAPLAVGIGALAALVTAVTVASLFGARLVGRLPVRSVQRAAAALLLVLGVGALSNVV